MMPLRTQWRLFPKIGWRYPPKHRRRRPGKLHVFYLVLSGGVEVMGTLTEYVNIFSRPLLGEDLVESGRKNAVGEVALAEQGIAEMALAEKAPSKEEGVVEEAVLARESSEDAATDDATEEAAVVKEDLPKKAFSETQDTENNDPGDGVGDTALLAVFDVERVIAETALAKAASEERSKGNVLETSLSAPSFSRSQVLETAVIDPMLGEDPISLS
jgi:hypothetical protein